MKRYLSLQLNALDVKISVYQKGSSPRPFKEMGYTIKEREQPSFFIFQLGIIRAPAGRPITDRADDTGGVGPERFRFGECLFLQFDVGVKIYLRGVHGFMSEPHRDYRTVHAVLQKIHRGAVAQDVWGHTFGF
jgi:hypothetical protein